MFGEPRNDVEAKICDLEKKLQEMKGEISKLRADLPPEKVENYTFKNLDGSEISLSDLFGDKDDLLVVHNMGKGCPYCALWADGFRTMKAYIETRCGFVLENDMPAGDLKEFATQRQWDFNVVSSEGGSFKKDMGFKGEQGNYPGVSSFFKKDGEIFRHATAPFGPGDDFCHVWPFFDLLKGGAGDWQPKFNL